MTKLAAIAVFALLALPAPSFASSRCGRSNIDGDRITATNDFQVGRISCENALRSATGYVDSAAAVNTTVPGTETFTAEFYEWRYRWTCRTVELPKRELRTVDGATFGTDYRCSAEEELGGRRRGVVYMSFKWWLVNERDCPSFGLADEVNGESIAREVSMSRNVSCSAGSEWLKTAAEAIQYHLEPYKVKVEKFTLEPGGETEEITRYYYHYFYNERYDCDVWPTKLSENGPKRLSCEPVTRSWQSTEYGFTEK